MTLRIVGPAWLADDLDCQHDAGFEIADPNADYWCSGAHYARLRASGLPIRFTTPGGLLPLLEAPRMTKRSIQVIPLSQLAHEPPSAPSFTKPNDLKLNDSFPALTRTPEENSNLARTLLEDNPHWDKLPIACSEPVNFTWEYRLVIIQGRVMMAHAYSNGAGIWGRETPPPAQRSLMMVKAFVQEFVSGLRNMPLAYIVDAGETEDRGLVIIETNPASSSGWYALEPTQQEKMILRTVILLGQHDDKHTEWLDPITFLRTAPLPYR